MRAEVGFIDFGVCGEFLVKDWWKKLQLEGERTLTRVHIIVKTKYVEF